MIKRTHMGIQSGFTIVETMIVIAITGLIFLGIASLVAGRQQETTFQTAIRDAEAQVQEAINETAAGYYPPSNFMCDNSGPGGSLHTQQSAGGDTQGTNASCVYLGKALHFSSCDGGSNIPADSYDEYAIAGLRSATGQFYKAKPAIVTYATKTNQLQGGLCAASMHYHNGNASGTIGSVAFVQSLGSDASATDADYDSPTTPTSGSQSLNLVLPTTGSSLTAGDPSEANNLTTAFASYVPLVRPTYLDSSVTTGITADICLKSGTTKESGLITIGDGINGLAVGLKIFQDLTCS